MQAVGDETGNGFRVGVSADAPERRFLAATGPWSAAAAHYAQGNAIRELHLTAYAGWADDDIAFVRDLPQLEALHLAPGKSIDLTPLYSLPHLRLLSLAGEIKSGVDFTRLAGLRELRLEKWNEKKFASAFACTALRVLALSNYPGPDLHALSGLASLEELRLSHGRVTSLHGISALTRLKKLALQEFNHLETLAGIEGLAELEDLWIYRAKNLKRLDGAEGLQRLTTLTLTSVPGVESLRPIAQCASLERVILLQNTNVADGDVAILRGLPRLRQVRFTDRKHYNATAAQLSATAH